jgi:HD superfamily phosphodiesterase
MVSEWNFYEAKVHIFKRIENELPDGLYYHGLAHTKDVLLWAEQFARIEGVTKQDLIMVKTAAAYHDSGFIFQYEKNEPIGVKIAWNYLPKCGYSNREIERISEIIMATQMKSANGKVIQIPNKSDLLQRIICDADLNYLGREDFFEISENLRLELKKHEKMFSKKEWIEGNIKFLKNHSYFTNAAKLLRSEGKKRNLSLLEENLSQLTLF